MQVFSDTFPKVANNFLQNIIKTKTTADDASDITCCLVQ